MILLMHSLVLLIIQCWLASERVSNTDYNTLKFSFFKCSVKIQFLASAAAAKLLQSCPTLCRQPTRLPRPWDSPGKDTGVGCHFLLQGMKVKSESEVTQSCRTLSDPMDCSPSGSSIHGIFQARVLEWAAIAFSIWQVQSLPIGHVSHIIIRILLGRLCSEEQEFGGVMALGCIIIRHPIFLEVHSHLLSEYPLSGYVYEFANIICCCFYLCQMLRLIVTFFFYVRTLVRFFNWSTVLIFLFNF